VVHVGLVAEFSLIAAGVAEAVPWLDADEGGLLLIGAPEGDDGAAVVEGHGGRAVGVEQACLMGLAVVDLDAVVGEERVVEGDDAVADHVEGYLRHLVGAVDVALQTFQGLLVVEGDDAVQGLVLAAAWGQEGGVAAYLEVDVAHVGVLHVPDDVDLVAAEAIGDGEVEAEWIDLQRLLRLVEGVGQLRFRLMDEGELRVAGEAVAGQVICLAVDVVGVVLDAADEGEEDG